MEKIITCLIIDDDPDDHEIFQLAIQHTCLQVNCIYTFDCFDAMRSLEKVDISVPDFLFIDWNLNAMNGPECLFHLNQLPLAKSHVIFYSGSLPPAANADLSHTPNQYFLKKSNSVAQFASELKTLLVRA